MTQRSHSGRPDARRAVLLVVAVLVLAAVIWLQWGAPASPPGPPGAVAWRDEGRPVLLLLDAGWGSHPASHDFDPSAEWVNLLEQTFGNCDVQPSQRLLEDAPSLLNRRSLVVIPRRVLQSLDVAVRDTLDAGVGAGEFVVVTEAPDEEWASALGLRTSVVERRQYLPWPYDRMFSFLQGPGLPPPPARIPTPWSVWRFAPGPDPQTQSRVGAGLAGRPGLWTRPVGSGAWVILNLDAGELAWRMHHPAPETLPTLTSLSAPWWDAWASAILQPDAAPLPWPRLDGSPFGGIFDVVDSALAPDPNASTALPFHALDSRGRLLPALSFGRPPSSPERAGRVGWSRWNQSGLRGPRLEPDELADSTAVPVGAFEEWWSSRNRRAWRWSWQDPWLEVRFQAGDPSMAPLSVVLPRLWQRRPLLDWEADSGDVRSRAGWRFQEEVVRFEIPRAPAVLRVRYGDAPHR